MGYREAYFPPFGRWSVPGTIAAVSDPNAPVADRGTAGDLTWDVACRPKREQFGYWREVICQAFVPLAPAQLRGAETFLGRVAVRRPLVGVVRARIHSHAQRTSHGPAEVARTDGEYVFVNLQVAGNCAVEQAGRTALVRPGQFTVLDTTRPYLTVFDGPWEMVSYRIPRQLLGGRFEAVRRTTAHAWDTTGVGSLVAAVMASLWDLDDAAGPAGAEIEHVMVAALAAAVAQRSVPSADRQERLAAQARREIEQGLLDPALGVRSVSRRLGVSPRTLHAAVSAGGETFAATLRRRRLEHAAMLLATAGSRTTVTEIGASVCFDGPASFSRAFRRQFGRTPSEVRRGGLRSAGPG